MTSSRETRRRGAPHVDVLVVGAGPTGLTLAAQLAAFGTAVRIVDRTADRVHESRALAIQPRSLEILRGLGIADELVERGRTAIWLELRAGRRRTRLELFDLGVKDTAFPFLLFLSQAETERALNEHLAGRGTTVERRTELVAFEQDEDEVVCTLRSDDGEAEVVAARYVVGCDGAESTVRRMAGIPFVGGRYAPTFLLADVEVDGDLHPDVAYAYLASRGILFFFPLGHPTTWRVIGRVPDVDASKEAPSRSEAVELSDVQMLVDSYAEDGLRVHDPAWQTRFGLQHRHAGGYRARRVFVAGDAAHVHSPAGAQGMNTGMQDAWNLGWKLALVSSGVADPDLLDTYHVERWPVGRWVIRLSDRAFSVGTSTNRITSFVRTRMAPTALSLIARVPQARAVGFRAIADLDVRYRGSPAVAEGQPRLKRGPRAGDRLPDARIERDGKPCWLQEAVSAPVFHLLLCGDTDNWDAAVDRIGEWRGGIVRIHRLTRAAQAGALHDDTGQAFARLGVEGLAQYLIRPDGYVAFRSASADVAELTEYLDRWLPGPE